jgi:hypothetical protein
MRIRHTRGRSRECAPDPRVRVYMTRLVAEVGNRATAWREAADDAEFAFRAWQTTNQADRANAAAVYLAAIEREEKAANEYRDALDACSATVP